MGDHLARRVPVGNDHAVEAPLLAQHIAQQKVVARRGYAVDLVERGHERQRTGIDTRLESGEIGISERTLRDHRRVVVATALDGSVAHEVLDARRHRRGVGQVVALIAPDHSHAHLRIEVGVFARALGHTAPTRVARDVEHRRECPPHTRGRGLDGRHASALLDQLGVERGRQTQRYGEYGSETVNHVTAYDNGNAQTALLDGRTLHGIDLVGIDAVEYRAYLPLGGSLGQVGSARHLVHLADLLAKSHLREQLVDLALDIVLLGTAGQQDAGKGAECG